MTVTHSTIRNNTDSGIVNLDALLLTDTIVSDNTAAYAGGGIYNAFGTATLIDSTVIRNYATQGGGIITYTTLTLTRSTVSLNTATDGGGIFSIKGNIVVTSSKVSRNTATDRGGGIYNAQGTLTLSGYSAVIRNTAGIEGGGIYSYGGTLTNCINGLNILLNKPDNIA